MEFYDGDVEDRNNFGSSSFLQLNSCGVQIKYDNEIHILRRHGRCDYHILFVCDGECQIFYEEKSYILKKGNIVLYPPDMTQEYILYKRAKSIWLHFNGFETENILSEAKIDYGVHYITYSPLLETILLELISEHTNITKITNEKGLLLLFLYSLGKIINSDYKAETKISDCVRYITTHYNTDITVKDLAKSCNLSESRFSHLFKSEIGISPRLYQQELRLNNAKLLLVSTNLSVAEICVQSGYSDPLYFSRIFKQKVGVSPAEYRKRYFQN